jgi:hypothetical protein
MAPLYLAFRKPEYIECILPDAHFIPSIYSNRDTYCAASERFEKEESFIEYRAPKFQYYQEWLDINQRLEEETDLYNKYENMLLRLNFYLYRFCCLAAR